MKLKVGLGDDAARLAAVRAFAGPGMEIRIDANGAWSPEEAVAHLNALEPVGIELCEEPVSGLEQIAELESQTEIPLAVDESAVQPGAFDRRVCALMCLKIARCGGVAGVIDAAGRARAPATRSTSPRRSTDRWGSPPRCTRRPSWPPSEHPAWRR